jgi:hypothetical protein
MSNNSILYYIMCIETLSYAKSFKPSAVCVTVQIAVSSHNHMILGYIHTARRTSLSVA